MVLGQMFWVISLVQKWTGSFGLSLVPWVLCGFLGAFYFAFIGVLVRGAFLRGYVWAIPLVWAGVEIGRSFIPGLAFPWFLLSTPLARYPALDAIGVFRHSVFSERLGLPCERGRCVLASATADSLRLCDCGLRVSNAFHRLVFEAGSCKAGTHSDWTAWL